MPEPDLLGPNGAKIAADTLRAQLARKAQADADRIISARTSELGAYDLEAVLELGRHVV